MRPIAESARGLWPTPEGGAFGAADPEAILRRSPAAQEKHGNNGFGLTLGQMAALWPTPATADSRNGRNATAGRSPDQVGKHHAGVTLSDLAFAEAKGMSLWPTPTPSPETSGSANEAGNSVGLAKIRAIAMWATPTSTLGSNAGLCTPEKAASGGTLVQDVSAALWALPTGRDWRSGHASPATHERNSRPLSEQAVAFGPDTSGSSGQTARPGALNPAFVCWLMGYPPAFLACAPSVTLSSRSSRRKSSPPTSKAATSRLSEMPTECRISTSATPTQTPRGPMSKIFRGTLTVEMPASDGADHLEIAANISKLLHAGVSQFEKIDPRVKVAVKADFTHTRKSDPKAMSQVPGAAVQPTPLEKAIDATKTSGQGVVTEGRVDAGVGTAVAEAA